MDSDCAIIGAGPAGLHAATYLGRFRRSVFVFHGGKPRAAWIPTTYNFPGFPQGISGPDLLSLMRREAERYNAEFHREQVCSVEGTDNSFIVRTPKVQVSVRKIIFATGVSDIPPDIPDAAHYKGRTIRHCPICDAYEARDRRVAVIGPGDHSANVALWLNHYTDDMVVLTNDGMGAEGMSSEMRDALNEAGIPVKGAKIAEIQEDGRKLGTIRLDDGTTLKGIFRGYSAMGLRANSSVAADMGVECDENGYVITDRKQRTSIPGVYAVGDIVSGDLGQLSVAVGHSATAATDIHNALLGL